MFFARLCEILGDAQPDMELISALTEEYGLSFDHSWLPDIEARFGPMRMI